METKICHWYTCKDPATHGVHCYPHYRQWGLTASYETGEEKQKAEKPKPAAIPKQSDKAKLADKEYKKLVKLMLAENNKCELQVPGVCTITAQGLHHIRKRAKHTLKDKNNLKRACNACNSYCETNPIAAAELGIVQTKFNQTV